MRNGNESKPEPKANGWRWSRERWRLRLSYWWTRGWLSGWDARIGLVALVGMLVGIGMLVAFASRPVGPAPAPWFGRGPGPIVLTTPQPANVNAYRDLDMANCLRGRVGLLDLRVDAWQGSWPQSQFTAVCSAVRSAWRRDRLPFTEAQLRMGSAVGVVLLLDRLSGDHAVGDMRLGEYLRTLDRLEGLYLDLYEATLP